VDKSTITIAGLVFATILLAVGLGVVWCKQRGGWGPRNIQALGLALVLPVIVALASLNAISTEVIATLLGGIIGYVLRGYDPDRDNNSESTGEAKKNSQKPNRSSEK